MFRLVNGHLSMQLSHSKLHAPKAWVFCPSILISHGWSQKIKEETNEAKVAKTLRSHLAVYPTEVGMQNPF